MLSSAFEYLLCVFHCEWGLCCYSSFVVLTRSDQSFVQNIADGLNTADLIGYLQKPLSAYLFKKNIHNIQYKLYSYECFRVRCC